MLGLPLVALAVDRAHEQTARTQPVPDRGKDRSIEEVEVADQIEATLLDGELRDVRAPDLDPIGEVPSLRLSAQDREAGVGPIDRDHAEAVLGQEERVPPGAAGDVECKTACKACDRFGERGRGDEVVGFFTARVTLDPLGSSLVHRASLDQLRAV